jgi:hypothetical protein
MLDLRKMTSENLEFVDSINQLNLTIFDSKYGNIQNLTNDKINKY